MLVAFLFLLGFFILLLSVSFHRCLTFCISSSMFCQHQEETKLKNSWSCSLCEDYSDCLYINSSYKGILKELWDFIKEKRASLSCPPERLIHNISSSLICATFFQSSIWSQSDFWIKLWKKWRAKGCCDIWDIKSVTEGRLEVFKKSMAKLQN